MRKPSDNFPGFDLHRSWTAFCVLDDLGEILAAAIRAFLDMGNAGPAGHAGGVDPVSVGVFDRSDAVGCHQNRSVERGELLVLLPPRIAIVTDKVSVFLEFWIVVGR